MPSNASIILPKPLSLRRWQKLVRSRHSLLRTLQYEALEGCVFDGRVLDLGGDWRSGYHQLLKVTGPLETVNINPDRMPTHCLNLEDRLPFGDESFDHVISLNTFEHICNDELAISEALRVLRMRGTYHFAVPFCYRVHASPSDYHRHTAYWWIHFLQTAGMAECTVEPLVWDRRSTAFALINVKGICQRFVMLLALMEIGYWARRAKDMIPILQSLPWRPGAARMGAEERKMVSRVGAASFALGYYISGVK